MEGGRESVAVTAGMPGIGMAKIHKIFLGQLDVGEDNWLHPSYRNPTEKVFFLEEVMWCVLLGTGSRGQLKNAIPCLGDCAVQKSLRGLQRIHTSLPQESARL